jgi:hypothetical protein
MKKTMIMAFAMMAALLIGVAGSGSVSAAPVAPAIANTGIAPDSQVIKVWGGHGWGGHGWGGHGWHGGWRGGYGWRGAGWRGYGWRPGWSWRPGWGWGPWYVAPLPYYAPAYYYGDCYNGCGYRPAPPPPPAYEQPLK